MNWALGVRNWESCCPLSFGLAACQIRRLAGGSLGRELGSRAGFFLWSLATAATGLIHGFAVLASWLRLLLGIGESVAYPCYSKILAALSTSIKRGLPNALIDAGTKSRAGAGHAGGRHLHGAVWAGGRSSSPWGLGQSVWLPALGEWMRAGRHRRPATPAEFRLSGLSCASVRHGHLFALLSNYFWYSAHLAALYLVRERHFSMT